MIVNKYTWKYTASSQILYMYSNQRLHILTYSLIDAELSVLKYLWSVHILNLIMSVGLSVDVYAGGLF